MKNKIIISSLISSAVLLNPGISFAKMNNFKLTPYGGVDVGMQHFGFKSGYGDNLFKKRLPKGNIFVGLKFNDYFGIEGGYETTVNARRRATLSPGEINLGIQVPAGYTFNHTTRIKSAGLHIGITGEYAFTKFNNNLSIFGYAGIKRTKIQLTRNINSINGGTASGMNYLNHNHENSKNIARISGGLQYSLCNHVKLRALVGWENTSKLKAYSFNSNNDRIEAKLKNSVSYTLGILLK